METVIPKTSTVLAALLRADLTTQWRNRRAVILTLIVPVIILSSWKGMVASFGGPFVLSNSITIGLIATGLMGYSNAIARDRDKGIFQRLRVAPVTSWAIMASRLFVQMLMIIMITTLVFIAGNEYDHITLTPSGYAFTYLTAIVGGAVYLSLGQMIVGRITNPETVNSTTRLVYFLFIMVGMFGELNVLGKTIHDLEHWSPYVRSKLFLPQVWNPLSGTTIPRQRFWLLLVIRLYLPYLVSNGLNGIPSNRDNMANTFSQIYLQFVFAVQNRQSLITKEHKEELHKYITALVQKRKAKMLAVNCMPDHTHLFVGFKPTILISDFIKEIKVESNEFINDKNWTKGKFNWQEGYGVFSYSHSHLDNVIKYVLNQEVHHQKKTFKQEYLSLLEKFEIPFEEKYLFDFLE